MAEPRTWRGEDLDDPAVAVASPAYVAWQTELLSAVLKEEGFGADDTADLLLTNYKQADLVGHGWGMESARMADAIRALDAALGKLIGLLDRSVGRGRWVLTLTADHGSTPSPKLTGGIAIDERRLASAIRARFDSDSDGRSVLEALSPSQAWLDRAELAEEGATVGEVARFVAGYGGGRLFTAAFPGRLLAFPRCQPP